MRKIIIFGLIVLVAAVFYKKFMADIMEFFFRENKGKVDFLQKKFQITRLNNE